VSDGSEVFLIAAMAPIKNVAPAGVDAVGDVGVEVADPVVIEPSTLYA
jgi:hypothetical protein